MRQFAATKARYEAADDKSGLEGLPLIGVVIELEHELVKERGGE